MQDKAPTFKSAIKSLVRGSYTSVRDGVKGILRDTPAEIGIGAMIGLSLFGSLSYRHEAIRTHQIPLGFSEIHQIEENAKNAGKEVGPINRFYAYDNDMRMKIFEAWNDSWKTARGNDNYKQFAKKLEHITDYSSREHRYNLTELLDTIPPLANVVMDKLGSFDDVRGHIALANQNLGKAWNESHIDNYHAETHVTIETDSDGDTHIGTEIVSVYDDTTHSYTFESASANLAATEFASVAKEYPYFKWPETLLLTSKVNSEGERAARESRTLHRKEPLNQKEVIDIANKWNIGSTYNINQDTILNRCNSLPEESTALKQANTTAHSTSYTTTSHSDAGPLEFQIAQKSLNNGRQLEKSLGEVLNGVRRSQMDAPLLERTIRDYTQATIGYSVEDDKIKVKNNPKKLQEIIMTTAKEGYKLNFKDGFDVYPFRAGYIFLFGALGALAGGLVGLGIDKAGQGFNWYDKQS